MKSERPRTIVALVTVNNFLRGEGAELAVNKCSSAFGGVDGAEGPAAATATLVFHSGYDSVFTPVNSLRRNGVAEGGIRVCDMSVGRRALSKAKEVGKLFPGELSHRIAFSNERFRA